MSLETETDDTWKVWIVTVRERLLRLENTVDRMDQKLDSLKDQTAAADEFKELKRGMEREMKDLRREIEKGTGRQHVMDTNQAVMNWKLGAVITAAMAVGGVVVPWLWKAAAKGFGAG